MIQMPFVRRMLPALATLGLLLQAGAAPAAAAGPVRQPIVIPSPGALFFCTFEVDYVVDVNTSYSIVFYDAAGNPVRALTEGHLVVTFTNASNPGHTATLNISGPGQTTFNADGSETIVSDGNWIIFTSDQVIYSKGRLVLVAPDPLSPGAITSAVGVQRSLCSMLA